MLTTKTEKLLINRICDCQYLTKQSVEVFIEWKHWPDVYCYLAYYLSNDDKTFLCKYRVIENYTNS